MPPVMYSSAWSPTPSTTAVTPELRTQEPLADLAAQEQFAAGGAVRDDVAGDDIVWRRRASPRASGRTMTRPPLRPLAT